MDHYEIIAGITTDFAKQMEKNSERISGDDSI